MTEKKECSRCGGTGEDPTSTTGRGCIACSEGAAVEAELARMDQRERALADDATGQDAECFDPTNDPSPVDPVKYPNEHARQRAHRLSGGIDARGKTNRVIDDGEGEVVAVLLLVGVTLALFALAFYAIHGIPSTMTGTSGESAPWNDPPEDHPDSYVDASSTPARWCTPIKAGANVVGHECVTIPGASAGGA